MSSPTFQPPEPVELDPYNADAYYAYLDELDLYAFKTRWLAIALSPSEFAATAPVAPTILADMYPEIREEGPMGQVWYTQLRAITAILNGDMDDVDPADFLHYFSAVYYDLFTTYITAHDRWRTLNRRLAEDENKRALTPDVDSYLSGPPHAVRFTSLANNLNARDPETYFRFTNALEEHAKVVLTSYELRRDPDAAVIMDIHDHFVARYRLLPN